MTTADLDQIYRTMTGFAASPIYPRVTTGSPRFGLVTSNGTRYLLTNLSRTHRINHLGKRRKAVRLLRRRSKAMDANFPDWELDDNAGRKGFEQIDPYSRWEYQGVHLSKIQP